MSIFRSETLVALLFVLGVPLSALAGAAAESGDSVIVVAQWDFDTDPDCRDSAGWTSAVGDYMTPRVTMGGGWGLLKDVNPDTGSCSWSPRVIHDPDHGVTAYTTWASPEVARDLVSPGGEGCLELPVDARSPAFHFRELGLLSGMAPIGPGISARRAELSVIARPCPQPDTVDAGVGGDGTVGATVLNSSTCSGSRLWVDASVGAPEPRLKYQVYGCGAEDRVLARFGNEVPVGSLDEFTTLTADLGSLAGQGPFQLVIRHRMSPETRVFMEGDCREPSVTLSYHCAAVSSTVALDSFRVTVEA